MQCRVVDDNQTKNKEGMDLMKHKRFTTVFSAILVLLLSVSAVSGQNPRQNTAPDASVSSAISYQGFLQESGVPVTGSRNMVFRLYSDGSCTAQVGSDIVMNGVPVAEGFFSVDLAVDQNDFNGQALWLRISIGGVPLGCQELMPVPYALSLRPGAEVSGTVNGGSTFSAHNPNSNGYGASFSGYSGIYVEASWDAIYVADAGDGLDVNQADTGIHLGTVGAGLVLDSATNVGISMNSVGGTGIEIFGAGNDGAHIYGGTNQSTDHGGWFSGYNGVYGKGSGTSGYGGKFESTYAHGLYVDAGSGSTDHGVYVDSAGGHGLYVGSAGQAGVQIEAAGGQGVYVVSAGDAGVYVEATGGEGIHVDSANGGHGVYAMSLSGASTDYGGYFQGYHGVYGKGTGASGYGGYFESTYEHGVYGKGIGNFNYGGYFESANSHSIYVTGGDDFGDHGIHVDSVAGDGVHVYAAENWGVYADTTAASHEWGLRTPDKLYVGTTIASAGALTMVAQNGGKDALEVGDVVAAVGVGAPFADSDVPIPLVQLADAGNNAVVGVVYSRFVVEERVEEVQRQGQVEQVTTFDSHSTEGPAAPGEYLLIVVLGVAEAKVDASAGAIAVGERLTVSEAGGQVRALQTRLLEGMTVTEGAPGIGYALASPIPESGTILVFVTLR